MSRLRTGVSGVLDPELESEIEAIAESSGCELVHAEFKGGFLRVIIDREPGGVDLADCERVSKQISALLDVVDFGDSRYTLEVGSPGLDRQLFRPRDYERFVGRRVKVTFRETESGRKKTVVGLLEGFVPGVAETGPAGGEATVVEPGSGRRYTLPLDDIEVARLEIEL